MWKPHRKTTEIGKAAEDYALAYLQRRGLRLLARNWRWSGGEIDLILKEGDTLVFVEVRCRADDRFGGAAVSVDRRKRRRLLQGAALFLAQQGKDVAARFDVVALAPKASGFQINWIRNAFGADD
ncbi:MAG TPA: YraN family protein [Methylothermaceae bacterium]|nr:YraN family protein [Methylothermaceae bacterium]